MNDLQDFKVKIVMDFSSGPETIELVRKAESAQEIKNQLASRLNPGQGKAVVPLVDQETGELLFIHSMKFGHARVTGVDK